MEIRRRQGSDFRGKAGQRTLAWLMAAVVVIAAMLPKLSIKTALADTGIALAWGEGWNYYCIDGSGYTYNCGCTKNDQYKRAAIEESLNSQERAIVFWSMLSFMAVYRQDEAAAGRIAAINQGAEAAGLKPIGKAVTEADLKGVIHSAAVRARYDWLDYAVARQEEYLRLAGFLSGTVRTSSGKDVPDLLKDATSPEKAARAEEEDGVFVLKFDPGGRDRDFLKKVPLKLSSDGVSWSEKVPGGWKVEKTDTQVRMFNPDPEAQPLYLQFDPAGTDYEAVMGSYQSPEECYSQTLELWRCVQCAGTHAVGGKVHPLGQHQRMVWMELGGEGTAAAYYASLGGKRMAGEGAGGQVEFQIYRHKEDMDSDYLVQLYKYDYETGKPLEGAVFDLYERFDDREQVRQETGEAGAVYESAMTHSPTLWNGFRLVASVRTDSQGRASYRAEKRYRYDKTFCDGHPAPVFVESSGVDEEDGEAIMDSAGEDEAEDGEGAAVNAELAAQWLACVSACETMEEDGTHFHWIMDGVDGNAIEAAAASGEAVDGGITRSADAGQAYEESGCRQDCKDTYKAFISMRYSYTFVEKAAREGYVLHGMHREDIPVEIITTDASQNGANGVFGGGYSSEIPVSAVKREFRFWEDKKAPETVQERGGGPGEADGVPDSTARGRGESGMFANAYEEALHSASRGQEVQKGPSDLYSHGGGMDGAEEAWRIYDHRTEGEIHINKRDMELSKQETEDYSSYGDTQGDGVLEGALYGLFAAQDLIHPDGTTGAVFRQNDLVAIAATDREGNASFPVITEPPGSTYDYAAGAVIPREDSHTWQAPENLYVREEEIRDYRPVSSYARRYTDLRSENGSCWVGRPLLLGEYYVKELSRSEGYELSVSGRSDPVSNYGYSPDIAVPKGEGRTAVVRAPYVERQSSGEEEDTMPNVVNFAVASEGTGEQGYDMVLRGFPEGTRLYRKDRTEESREISAVTGRKEKRYLFDSLGQPVYQRADKDGVYPKLLEDGSFMTEEAAVDAVVLSMGAATVRTFDEELIREILETGSDGDTEDEERNSQPLEPEGQESSQFLYVKMKTEEILRACGLETPWKVRYSDRTEGIYDRGIRQGEPDYEGISGAVPGDAAAKTRYGNPILTIEIPKTTAEGERITAGEAIRALVGFYAENPWYGFGGIHGYKEKRNRWQFVIYAGMDGNPPNVAVPGRTERDHMIFRRIPWLPDDRQKSPRWIYVKYGNDPGGQTFGGFRDFQSWQTLGQYRCSAVLETDAAAEGDGTIVPKTVRQNVYYRKGEILEDESGNPLQAYEWADIMTTVTQTQEVCTWTEIPVQATDGFLTAHGAGRYTDAYGTLVNDKETSVTTEYKLVLPQVMVTLTEEDIRHLPKGYGYGVNDTMGAGDYALQVMEAGVQIYSDFSTQSMTGDNVYVKPVSLTYPGQDDYFQDGMGKAGEGTRKVPVNVQERVICQPVKITKTIRPSDDSEPNPGEIMDNFRFKLYLKSNLKRLYRDEEGRIQWVDFRGNAVDPQLVVDRYPGLVPKLYTKADPGCRAIWETDSGEEEGFAKFCDAISVANKDKWKDGAPSFTSHRPPGNQVNNSAEAGEAAAVSDRVRQFAIDWYLKSEIEELTDGKTDAGLAYSDQLYDRGLREAVKKAQNYLMPFFMYDLDRIYAVKWDSEEGGGKDQDPTTLSADTLEEQWCSAVSVSLPYGTYMIVEQQPEYPELGDLSNRRYAIDRPREIKIPTVYSSYEDAVDNPQKFSGYYGYRRDDSPEELAAKYKIRFHEKNHVIKAHNYHGDFQVCKYGMNGVVTGGISDENGGGGDGSYSHVLVPWTMAMPVEEAADMLPGPGGESRYLGLAYGLFTNTRYKNRLRIEKLDAETHENLLHDAALFRLYRARGDDGKQGTGMAECYETETLITGSKEFLMGMGASRITKTDQGVSEGEEIYSGLAATGTPICREEDQVLFTDMAGRKVGEFRALTTTRDGLMEAAGTDTMVYGDQNAGYLETPEALEAGVYVLAEVSPPAGYTRTRPVAVEIYSDTTAYYKEGNPEDRVLATVYEQASEEEEKAFDVARIYVENTPVKLKAEKKKRSEDSVICKVSGRIEGSLAEIGGNPGYEYAYSRGNYLGYAWKKGTLEYLKAWKDTGAQVEIVYQDGVFAGYGYVTVASRVPEDENPYVAGAMMTLYEGLELQPSGDGEDHGYQGLVVERGGTGNVIRMYVEEGHAGSRIQFKKKENRQTGGVWDAVTVQRPDTDILYYDLGDLDVFTEETIDGVTVRYGYNRDHSRINLQQLNPDRGDSIFAFKGGVPYLELAEGDFTEMGYSLRDHILEMPEGAAVYHLDENGNRDARTDPYTGMAYVSDEETGTVYVWPVTVAKDAGGRRVAVDKITTCRVGTIGEYKGASEEPEEGYVTGTWRSRQGEKSHHMVTTVQNPGGENRDGEAVYQENNGSFEKYLSPVPDPYGLPRYYRNSSETYEKGTSLYDRDGDFVRRKTSDLLRNYRKASYMADSPESLREKTGAVFHRQGESYLMENTWITGERTPNDPFELSVTQGQADLLKRIGAGTYIMEELRAPEGYVKGLPVGVTVTETTRLHTAVMEDDHTKVLVRKLDSTEKYEYDVLDMGATDQEGRYPAIGTVTEGKGSFSHGQIPGVGLALYKAEKSSEGAGLQKTGPVAAAWETEKEPLYAERLEAGTYILEETMVPDGFVTGIPVEAEISGTGEVQVIDVYNDHTKVEFEKYTIDGRETHLVEGAGFTLYEAVTDGDGQVIYDGGRPVYNRGKVIDVWKSSDKNSYRDFAEAFEEMYRDYGTSGRRVVWNTEGKDCQADYVSHQQTDSGAAGEPDTCFPATADMRFRTDQGQEIRIVIYQQQDNRNGRDFVFEYQFDYRTLPHVNEYAVSYGTLDGMRRMDYLSVGKPFVLVETNPPEGYGAAPDRVIVAEDTDRVQRHRVLNQESRLLISKCVKDDPDSQGQITELEGAHMALYRAGPDGELIQEPGYLAAEWISGQDGVYTEADRINGKIPPGYQPGDKRPHELRKLPDGVYYLTELKSPDYYTLMEPVKFVYTQQEQIRVIRVRNEPVLGELEILKTDREGRMLEGAVFELTAYKEYERSPVLRMTLSSHDGRVHVSDLPAGEQTPEGRIVPYRYRLRETVPPKGYKADSRIYEFSVSPQKQGSSWSWQETDNKTMTIVNEKTKISVRKQDFDSPAEWVAGAEMAVYHVTGRNEAGQYSYDDEAPEAVWITEEGKDYELEGLIAGETYILTEKKAPEGFEVMKPCVFTLSADGRNICSITGALGMITVHSYEESDVIRSLEIQGRYGIRTEMELTDKNGEPVACWTAGGDGHRLTEKDGIQDKEVYGLTETTVYSDGTREITGYTTRRCHLNEEGAWRIPDRAVKRTRMTLAHESGKEIRAWNSSELFPKMELHNPAAPEVLKLTLSNQRGEEEDAAAGVLNAGETVWTEILCTNTGGDTADMTVTIKPGKGVTIIDPGEGSTENGQLTYVLRQVKPGQCRRLRYASQIDQDMTEVTASAVLRCMGRQWEETKTVPVLRKNRLTVFYEVTGTGKEAQKDKNRDFQIFLYAADGQELKGTYAYEGSRTGRLKSGQILSLSANEYVTIDPGAFYRNIRYKIVDLQEGRELTGQVEEDTGECGFFSEERWDNEDRMIFRKGQRYRLTETTYYSDGSVRESYKAEFSIGDQGSVEGIGVVDRKQTVSISKREVNGEKELEGALLQITDNDGTVLEQWVSGNEPYILNSVLIPGQTYILSEDRPPAGYAYEEEIGFRSKEGEHVNRIIMEDKPTEVIFSKKSADGQKELTGALLQVFDEEGNLTEQWISGTEPHKVTGKLQAGKPYRLHEESPPDGYGYADDIWFTVAKDGRTDLIEMRDVVTSVEVGKTDMEGQRQLPGAQLEILDQAGNVVCRWTSEETPHRIEGVLKAGTTYILREIYPPDGYALGADVEFTVSRDSSRDQVVIKDDVTRIQILKVDSQTGDAVAGAGMELMTSEGEVIETWITKDEPHLIEGKLKAGQTCIIRETAAPPGYRQLDQDIRIVMPQKAETLNVKVENEKRTGTSESVRQVKKEEKTGKVYIDYRSVLTAHGGASYGGFTNLGIPNLGDRGGRHTILAWLLGILGLLYSMAVIARIKRKREAVRRKFWLLGLILIFGNVMAISARAEVAEIRPEGQLVVTGDVYLTQEELPEPLPEVYQYKDREYERQSYQMVAAMTEGGTKEVGEEIIYEAVEQIDVLPDSAELLVTDERYGTEYRREFPAVRVDFSNWRWISGFQLPVIVEEADAGTYELNGIQVPAREEEPFAGYEEELLRLARVNPEYYRITQVRWTGEAWTGENGKLYRNAVAEGEKYVADCRVVYGGTAVLEPKEGVAWQAVYKSSAGTEREEGQEERERESKPVSASKSLPPEETAALPPPKPVWYKTVLGQLVISVGLLVILLPLALLFFWQRRRRRQKQQGSFTK